MVAGPETNRRLLERVAEVYKWLDLQVRSGADMAGACRSCGDCCDFDRFDHRLFITPPGARTILMVSAAFTNIVFPAAESFAATAMRISRAG